MHPSSRPPQHWTDCPPSSTDALARPVAAWGSRRGRLPRPRAVRVADQARLAWSLCAPEGSRASLSAWDPQTARDAWRYELPRAGVFDVSPDEAALFFTDATGWCVLLDATRGTELASLRDERGEPVAAHISRGPSRAALVLRNGRVRRWDLDARAVTHDLEGAAPSALSSDGRAFAYTNLARTRAWVVRGDGAPESLPVTRGRRVTAIDLGAEDAVLIGHDDGSVARYDASRKRSTIIGGGASAVSALRASGGGGDLRVARGTLDGETRVVRADGAVEAVVQGDCAVEHLAASLGAAAHREASAAVMVRVDPVERVDLREGHRDMVTSIAISRDGRTALTASRDGTLRLWDTSTGHTLVTLEGHLGGVRAVALSPDGRTAWSSGERDGLRAWDLSRSIELWHDTTLTRIESIAVSPDGSRLLAQCAGAVARNAAAVLLDADSGQVIARELIATVALGATGFTPDGALAALAFAPCNDGGLRLTLVDARTGADASEVIVPSADRATVSHRITAAGLLVTAASDRASLTVRDLRSGAVRARLSAGATLFRHTHLVVGSRVAIGTTSGSRVDVCELTSGAIAPVRLPHNHDAATTLALSPDERWFAVGTAQGLCIRYDLRIGADTALRFMKDSAPS